MPLSCVSHLVQGDRRQKGGGAKLAQAERGLPVTKEAMVNTIREVVSRRGMPIRDSLERELYGGHALRVGGSQWLSSVLHMDLLSVQLYARHSSNVILRYVRAAPLLSATQRTRTALYGESLGARCWRGRRLSWRP